MSKAKRAARLEDEDVVINCDKKLNVSLIVLYILKRYLPGVYQYHDKLETAFITG